MGLTHYIVVRRDLPLGVVCAMIVHAAGESGSRYQDPEDGRFKGATAVVLGVPNEAELKRVERKLWRNGVQYVAVHEPDPPYNGEFMAIGLVPTDRALVLDALREFQVLYELKPPKYPLSEIKDAV
jgi:hypothetical protein